MGVIDSFYGWKLYISVAWAARRSNSILQVVSQQL